MKHLIFGAAVALGAYWLYKNWAPAQTFVEQAKAALPSIPLGTPANNDVTMGETSNFTGTGDGDLFPEEINDFFERSDALQPGKVIINTHS